MKVQWQVSAHAVAFLTVMSSLSGGSLGTVNIRWKEDTPSYTGHRGPERPEDQINSFKRLMVGAGINCAKLQMFPWRLGRGGHFHDRQVIVDFATSNGTRRKYRWDLTSGIDNLMDPSKEAKVFRTKLV